MDPKVPRTLGQIIDAEKALTPPAIFSGRDFAALEEWMRERGALELQINGAAGLWVVTVDVHGREFSGQASWSAREAVESPLWEAVAGVCTDVEDFERSVRLPKDDPPRRAPTASSSETLN